MKHLDNRLDAEAKSTRLSWWPLVLGLLVMSVGAWREEPVSLKVQDPGVPDVASPEDSLGHLVDPDMDGSSRSDWRNDALSERDPQPGKTDRVYSRAAIVTVHREINDVTLASLTRRFEAARKEGIDLIVLELDTPGGYLSAALDIAHMIENTRDMTTVAWINPQAHSAGSMIAVACHEIVMAPSSTMGDSQVIMIGTEGPGAIPKELEPKLNTPVVSRFRSSARLRGYSEVLAEAFVIPEREVWWLENTQTGKREFVFTDEKKRRLGESSADGSAVRTAARAILGMSDPAPGPWKLVESYYDIVSGRELPLTQPVERSDELLEMDAGRAYAFGFNKALVADVNDLKQRYGVTSVTRMEPTWSENLTTWLTSPFVRGFLLIVVLLGMYVEFHTPGVGVAGLTSLIALVLFVGAPYLTGLANVWEIVAIILGLVLLAIEIFVIPGFGVAGILGILMMLLGLIATFVPEEPGRSIPYFVPHLRGTLDALILGVKTVVIGMVVSIVGMVILARFLPKLTILHKIIPPNPTTEAVLADDPYYGLAQVGDIGMALGPLRPAGKARFGAVLVDVVTQGEYVEPGTRVEVVDRSGNRIVVRPARET